MSYPADIIRPQVNSQQQADGVWSREAAGISDNEHGATLDSTLKLHVAEGDTVEATFPFQGDPEGSQLSFQIGDAIQVLQKDELWSWGKLLKTGEEGYFPHNYVQATFKPLPGMHELQLKIAIKKAREEAIQKGEDPDAAEAMLVNGGAPEPVQKQAPAEYSFIAQPEEVQPIESSYQVDNSMNMYGYNMMGRGMNTNSQMYGQEYNMQQHQQQQYLMQPPQHDYSQMNMQYGGYDGLSSSFYGGSYDTSVNNNQAEASRHSVGYNDDMYGTNAAAQNQNWSNAADVDTAFGMWVDFIDGGNKPFLPAPKTERETSSPVDNSSDKSDRRRQKLIKELLSSEEAYIGLMEALLETVIRPCIGDDGTSGRYSPVTQTEAEQMFKGLRTGNILKVSTNIRNELRSRVKQLDENSCIGDIFSKFTPSLRSYVDYCLNHEASAARLSFLARSNESFRSLLKRSKADPRSKKKDVHELMDAPKKRIPEYRASLERILRCTDESHADFFLIKKALDDLNDIANFIEEGGQWRMNQGRMAAIRAKMVDPPHDLCRPGRVFLRDGILKRLGKYFDREDYFVLFSDGLLQARPQTFKNRYLFKRIVNVLRVEIVSQIPGKKAHYPFRIVADGHIFLLNAMSNEHRTAWMRALTQVIKYGTRQLIHKGTLGMLKLEKDPVEVREEYFYVFSDVVVRGRTLWRDKFKHMQTLDVTRIEEDYMPAENFYGGTNLPHSFGHHAIGLCFRLIHIEGSVVLMAPSKSEKDQWIKALYKQQDRKREDAVKSITAARKNSTSDIYDYDSDSDGNSIKSKSSNVSKDVEEKKSSPNIKVSKKISIPPKKEPEQNLLDLSDDFSNCNPPFDTTYSRTPSPATDLLTNNSTATAVNRSPTKASSSSGLLDMDLAHLYATPSSNTARPTMAEMRQLSLMQGQQYLQAGFEEQNNMGPQPVYQFPPGTSAYTTQQNAYGAPPSQYMQQMPQGQQGYMPQQQVYNTQQQPGYYPSTQGW